MAYNLYLHLSHGTATGIAARNQTSRLQGATTAYVCNTRGHTARKYWPRVRHVRSNRTVCTNPALACATVIWLLTMVAHKILSAQVQAARARVALLSHTFAHITRVRDNITAQAAPPLLLIPPPASLASGRGAGWRLRAVRPADSAQMHGAGRIPAGRPGGREGEK
jgi:hypothetical protein